MANASQIENLWNRLKSKIKSIYASITSTIHFENFLFEALWRISLDDDGHFRMPLNIRNTY